MTILQNALDSIAIGLEDFESTDDRRIISSTRNIFAGILLLFKHRLCELSPADSDEVLIKQKVLPDIDATGAVRWIGKGKKTVDVHNIRERFESLDIAVDWVRLEKINRYRNDIEHYYSGLKSDSIQQLVSDSFVIIRDFIADELKQDPKTLLGEQYWKILVDINEVYVKEKQDCSSSLEKLSYFSSEIFHAFVDHPCGECGSGLIETKSEGQADSAIFTCRACEHEVYYDEIVSNALGAYYADDAYFAVKDGGDTPLIDCPECLSDVYIFSECICASCGYAASHECVRCGANIPPEEISDDDLCGYCQHMYARLMEE